MKNILTNGGFEFDQANEGELIALSQPFHTKYIADGMWMASNVEDNGAVVTGQRRINTGADEPPYSIKLNVVTPAASVTAQDRLRLHNMIGYEDGQVLYYGTPSAKTSSISFKIKVSHAGIYAFDIANYDGTRCLYNTFTVTTAHVWQYVTVDNIPGCTDGVWPRGSSLWGYLVFWATMGDEYADTGSHPNIWRAAHIGSDTSQSNAILTAKDGYIEIAEVMWVPGSVAVPFEADPLEYLRCKRRYQKSYDMGVKPGTPAIAPDAYNGAFYHYINIHHKRTHIDAIGMDRQFPVSMLGKPKVILYSPVSGAAGVIKNYNGSDIPASVYAVGSNGFTFFSNEAVLTPLSVLGHFTADSRF